MGFSAENLLVSLKGAFEGGEEMRKMLKSQANRKRNKRTRRVLMKSRKTSRRSSSRINRKIKMLKKLIPNSESMGMEGLFRETVDYILALQMRVRVMQIMVKVLDGSDE